MSGDTLGGFDKYCEATDNTVPKYKTLTPQERKDLLEDPQEMEEYERFW